MPPEPGYPAAGERFEGREPIQVGFAGPAPQSRLTVFFRILLAIPHAIVLYLVFIGAIFVLIVGWFGALFTGRLPQFAADYLTGTLRWQTRFQAYVWLLTDQYPPFSFNDSDYVVRLTTRPGPLNRLAVLFRIILAIPVFILTALLNYGLTGAGLVIWLIVLVRGSVPDSLHQAISAVIRFVTRTYGYYFMLTSEYPGGLYGDADAGGYGATAPYPGAAGYGAPAGYGTPGTPAPGGYGPPAGGPGYGAPAGGPGYGPPAGGPGYGAPAGDPGYGPPADGPGYDGPTIGGPAYGTPAAGGPGYGPPAGGAGYGPPAGGPGYGVPAGYGAPAGYGVAPAGNWAVPGPPPWRLGLSQLAKRLVTLFIVLGVIVGIGNSTFTSHLHLGGASVASRQTALNQTEAGLTTLGGAMSTVGAAVQACQNTPPVLPCIKTASKRAEEAFASLVSVQEGISMPTPGSKQASAHVISDLKKGGSIFERLSTASSAQQYNNIATTSGLQQLLVQLRSHYNQLHDALVNNK